MISYPFKSKKIHLFELVIPEPMSYFEAMEKIRLKSDSRVFIKEIGNQNIEHQSMESAFNSILNGGNFSLSSSKEEMKNIYKKILFQNKLFLEHYSNRKILLPIKKACYKTNKGVFDYYSSSVKNCSNINTQEILQKCLQLYSPGQYIDFTKGTHPDYVDKKNIIMKRCNTSFWSGYRKKIVKFHKDWLGLIKIPSIFRETINKISSNKKTIITNKDLNSFDIINVKSIIIVVADMDHVSRISNPNINKDYLQNLELGYDNINKTCVDVVNLGEMYSCNSEGINNLSCFYAEIESQKLMNIDIIEEEINEFNKKMDKKRSLIENKLMKMLEDPIFE